MICSPTSQTCTAATAGLTATAWRTVASMPQSSAARATALTGRLYVGYGSYFASYDPGADTWTRLNPDPAAPTVSGGQGAGYEALDGKVYGIAGASSGGALATVSAYSPGANSWAAVAPLLNPRYDFATGAWNGKLYVAGGTNQSEGLKPIEIFDPGANQWSAGPDMPFPTQAPMGAVIGGVFYVAGGFYTGAPTALRAYDIAAHSWSSKAALFTPRWYAGAAALNGLLYLVGGDDDRATTAALRTVDIYDPATDSWRAGPSLAVGRTLPGVAVVNGILYAAGGFDASRRPLDSVEALGP